MPKKGGGMRDHKADAQTRLALLTSMAAIGLVAGFVLGCWLAIPLAELHLRRYLSLVNAQDSISVREAQNLLAGMQTPSAARCSDAELLNFRNLVFHSEYIKDAGRMRKGVIDCSATAGRQPHQIERVKQVVTQADGTFGYPILVPIRDEKFERAGLQLGDAFVVFGAQLPPVQGSLAMHVTVTPANAAEAASRTGLANVMRTGSAVFATYCSPTLLRCVTVSATADEARQGEFGATVLTTGLGCIFGAIAGFLLSAFRRRRLSIEFQLRRSIEKNAHELEVVYQPIVNMVDGKIIGAEALTRWKDRDGRPVSPEHFIKVAEQSGFVGSLTRLVFRRALSDFREVLTKLPDFKLDINVTAADLGDPTFLPMLDQTLEQNKISPASVAIEVTESATANHEVAIETIRLLRRRGHSIYIDDFGTGYSSLSYLLYLSIDRIKIDKAFTRAIGSDAPTLAMLPQIMNMARSLNLGVVVEGVETEQQALYFTVNDQAIHGQGFLYGMPVPFAEFVGLIESKLARAGVESQSRHIRADLRASSIA